MMPMRRPGEREAIERLHSVYFATAAENAIRYGVGFDDVLGHIRSARQAGRQVLLRNVAHMDDLVHAVACTRMLTAAWMDLAERYERQIVRRCRHRMDELSATILTRRMFANLKLREQRARENSGDGSLLGLYAGTRPLRTWLADHTLAQISHACTPSGALFSSGVSASGSWWRIHGATERDKRHMEGDEDAVVLRFPATAVGS
jgi:hypothetical protein